MLCRLVGLRTKSLQNPDPASLTVLILTCWILKLLNPGLLNLYEFQAVYWMHVYQAPYSWCLKLEPVVLE